MKLEFFLERFSKNSGISNFMKMCLVGADLFHADGQTVCRCYPENSRMSGVSTSVSPFPHLLTYPLIHWSNSVVPSGHSDSGFGTGQSNYVWFLFLNSVSFYLSRAMSQACRRGSGSFEMVYFVLHDVISGIGMGVSVGSIGIQILTAPLFICCVPVCCIHFCCY